MENEAITINALADLLGTDRRRVKKTLASLTPLKTKAGVKLFGLGPALRRVFEDADSKRADSPAKHQERRERLRLLKARSELAAIELEKAKSSTISVDEVVLLWSNVAMAIRRIILTSALSDEEKDKILHELETFEPAQGPQTEARK